MVIYCAFFFLITELSLSKSAKLMRLVAGYSKSTVQVQSI